jgi:uncharacterized protein YfaT (DUF1175 family)
MPLDHAARCKFFKERLGTNFCLDANFSVGAKKWFVHFFREKFRGNPPSTPKKCQGKLGFSAEKVLQNLFP